MKKIAVFCSGNGSNFQAILDAVRAGKLRAEVAVMVCDNSKAYALKRAAKARVPVVLLSPKLFAERKHYEEAIVRILRSQKVDTVVLAGFMRIFTPFFIRAFRGRILNIHPSLLPAFKGAHAIRDAFDAEVATTGVSIHLVTVKVDAGPIVAQEKVKILPNDTMETLEKRIHAVEHKLYPAAIQRFLRNTPR